MMVMKPYDVNSTVLTSSSIPEPDLNAGEQEWVDISQKLYVGDSALEPLDAYVRFIDVGNYKIVITRVAFYIFGHPTIADFTRYAYGVSGACASHFYDEDSGRILLGGTFNKILSINISTFAITSFGDSVITANFSSVTCFEKINSVIFVSGVAINSYDPNAANSIVWIVGTSIAVRASITSNFYSSVNDGEYMYLFGDYNIKRFRPAQFSLESDAIVTLVTFSSASQAFSITYPVLIGDYVYGINNSGVVARQKDSASYGSLIYSSVSAGGLCEINGDLFLNGYNDNIRIKTSGNVELVYNNLESIATIGTSNIDGNIYALEISSNYTLTPNKFVKYRRPYQDGDFAILTNTHKIYKCATNSVISPDIGVQLETPEWVDYGYTNRYKMFTNTYDSQSSYESAIVTSYNFDKSVTSFGLLGLDAESVQLVMNDQVEGEVYNEIVSLDDSLVNNWWDWFFKEYDFIDNYVFSGLPPYPEAEITVSILNSTNNAKCGLAIAGVTGDLGVTDVDTEVGIINYTTRSRDNFGNLVNEPKRSINYCNYAVTCEINSVDNVKRILRKVADSPALFIGESDMDATVVYGIAEDFRLNYSDVSICNYTIEVKGA